MPGSALESDSRWVLTHKYQVDDLCYDCRVLVLSHSRFAMPAYSLFLHFSFNFHYEFPCVTVWSRNSSIYFYYQGRTWSSSRYCLTVEYHDLIVSLLKIHNVFTVTSRCNPHSDSETMAFCPRWIYIIGPRTLSGPRPRSRGLDCRVRRPLVWLYGLPASVSAVQRAM